MEITIKIDLKTGESSVAIKSQVPIDPETAADAIAQAAQALLKS